MSANQAHALSRVGKGNTFQQSILLYPRLLLYHTTGTYYEHHTASPTPPFNNPYCCTLWCYSVVPYYCYYCTLHYFILPWYCTYLSADHAHALGRVGECDVRAPGEVRRRFLHPVVHGEGAARRTGQHGQAERSTGSSGSDRMEH